MFSRRDFTRLLAISGAATLVASPARTAARPAGGPVKPKKLSPGDLIALVAPASLELNPDDVRLAQDQLEALGFRTRVGEHILDRHGFLAGKDRDRAADINAAFADPEVDAVFAYTGGWGSPRVLPHLDWDVIAANPKILLGFSDITALLNAVHQRTGLVTFHGPNGGSNLEPYSLEHLRRVLMSDQPIGVLENPPKGERELVRRSYRPWTIRGGRATGKLIGGNLTLLSVMMGTPYQVDTDGAILLIEDIREAPYRVDRMLTQMGQGGAFRNLAGVIWGTCTDCRVEGPTFSWDEILGYHIGSLGIPAFGGFAFGHIEKKLTLPIGLRATMDADAGTLTIDEAAVR